MEIKLAEDSMWGGKIPDILRNDRIKIKFNNLVILDLSSEEFDHLRTFLDAKTQNLFDIAQKIVKSYDARTKVMQELEDNLSPLLKKNEIMQGIFYDFYDKYWEV